MPLFECSKCHVVDNTAITNFWITRLERNKDKPALCSECDPAIGKWHGRFPRRLYVDYVQQYGEGAVEYPVPAWDCLRFIERIKHD